MERRETGEIDALALRVNLSISVPARDRAWAERRARALGFPSVSAYMRALLAHDAAAERAEMAPERASDGEGVSA